MKPKTVIASALTASIAIGACYGDHHFVDPGAAAKVIGVANSSSGSVSAIHFVNMTSGFEYEPPANDKLIVVTPST